MPGHHPVITERRKSGDHRLRVRHVVSPAPVPHPSRLRVDTLHEDTLILTRLECNNLHYRVSKRSDLRRHHTRAAKSPRHARTHRGRKKTGPRRRTHRGPGKNQYYFDGAAYPAPRCHVVAKNDRGPVASVAQVVGHGIRRTDRAGCAQGPSLVAGLFFAGSPRSLAPPFRDSGADNHRSLARNAHDDHRSPGYARRVASG